MSEPTLKKTHDLLETLTEYVMNEVPKKNEVATKGEIEKLAEYVINEVPTKRHIDKRFEQVDKRFEQVDKRFEQVDKRFGCLEEDVKETKDNVKLILDGMDAQVKQTEILKIEQVAIKSGLKRLEKRVDIVEKKVGCNSG